MRTYWPTVSVIVPVFNREQFIRDALNSLAALDYESVEVIVVDDGSTDTSGSIAESFAQSFAESFEGVRVIRQANAGVSAARNAGLAVASGAFIGFLDSDDTATPDKLRIQIGHLLDHPDTGCVLGRMETFFEPGFESPEWIRPDAQYGADGGIPAISLVAARDVFEVVGNFDETLPTTEDRDWLFRARSAGIKIDVIDKLVLRRRVHGGNLSGRPEELDETLMRSLHARAKAAKASQVSSQKGS